MSPLLHRLTAIAFLSALLQGCAVYENYGYGWVARSKLPPSQATQLQLPENAPSISQRFVTAEPGTGLEHRGIDLLLPGDTPVLAAAGGVVAEARFSIYFGRIVVLNHGESARGYRIQTRYYHLGELRVAPGDGVRRGQLLGYSGASGLAGVYPHLHFEVHRLADGAAPVASGVLDPQLFWNDGVGRITCYDRERVFDDSPLRLTYPAPCRGVAWK